MTKGEINRLESVAHVVNTHGALANTRRFELPQLVYVRSDDCGRRADTDAGWFAPPRCKLAAVVCSERVVRPNEMNCVTEQRTEERCTTQKEKRLASAPARPTGKPLPLAHAASPSDIPQSTEDAVPQISILVFGLV